MSRILTACKEKGFVIIVSIPQNDTRLARAADDSGVDAIKVHINVEHRASGTRFGSWEEEKGVITDIIDRVSCPVGIMPGAAVTATPEELAEAAETGIDFLDIYDADMPVWMLSARMTRMIAVGSAYTLADVAGLEKLGADMVEASIVPGEQYRQPLTVKDLEAYRSIVQATALPVVVPSQKRIEPEDLKALKEMGVKGVILGTISIGNTPESFLERLPLFINATR